MIALFYIVLVIGLIYSFRINSWARLVRMGFSYYTPAIYISYTKIFYLFVWIFAIGSFVLSTLEQVNVPMWLVPALYFIMILLARQYAAFNLIRNLRKEYERGEFLRDPDTNRPMTPKERLKLAYDYEKISKFGWRGWKYLK
jgi:hypothetical protein